MNYRSLENINNSGNADSIAGFPIIETPLPVNGDLLTFQSNSWIYSPASGIGITGITNIGGANQIYAGEIGGIAQLRTLATSDSNMAVTTSGNSILINGPTSPHYTFITTTGLLVNNNAEVVNQFTVNGPTILNQTAFVGDTLEVGNTATFDSNIIVDTSASIGTTLAVGTNAIITGDTNSGSITTSTINAKTSHLIGLNAYQVNLTSTNTGGTAIFQINGNSSTNITPELTFNDNAASANWSMYWSTGLSEFIIQQNGTAMGQNMKIFLNGGTLTLSGKLNLTGALYDSTASPGTPGQILTTTGTGTVWSSTSSVVPTIFSSNGFINIGPSGVRTIAMTSYSPPETINFLGGFLQNNFAAITNTNGTFTIPCSSDVCADSNGIFRGYAMSKSKNSARLTMDVQALTGTGFNSIDFYEFTAGYNQVCYADIFFVWPGQGNVNSYSWRVNTCYGLINNFDVWSTLLPRTSSGWEQISGIDFILEMMCPSSSVQSLIFRIRQIGFGTIFTPDIPATITLVTRNTDTAADGTWTAVAQTPYSDTNSIDGTNFDGFNPHVSSQTFSGNGQPSTINFTIYGQKFIRFMYTMAVNATNVMSISPPSVSVSFILNGIDLGTDITQQGSNNGETLYFTYTGAGILSIPLLQAGFITSYAPNVQSAVLNIPLIAGVNLDFANYYWQITIDQWN